MNALKEEYSTVPPPMMSLALYEEICSINNKEAPAPYEKESNKRILSDEKFNQWFSSRDDHVSRVEW